MRDDRDDALVTLRAAYPEWTFELDGHAISARLAPSRYLVLWAGVFTWKMKVITWPGSPALRYRLDEYVASSPDEVRCMAALLKAIAAAEGAAAEGADGPDAPEAAAEPAGDDLEAALVEVLSADLVKVKAERDEARAELERVKAAQDSWDAAMREEFGREMARVQAELEQVRKERDGLAVAPIWYPLEQVDAVGASVPEPPPRAGGALVTPMVLAWIASQRANVGEQVVDLATRLVMERDAFGRGKYPQGLSFEDGRDTVEDLRQELGDALQYGYKARVEGVEGERLEEVRWLAHVLWLLLCADKVEVPK